MIPIRCEGADLSACVEREPHSYGYSHQCGTGDLLCLCEDGQCSCWDVTPPPDGPPRPTGTVYQGRGVCRPAAAAR